MFDSVPPAGHDRRRSDPSEPRCSIRSGSALTDQRRCRDSRPPPEHSLVWDLYVALSSVDQTIDGVHWVGRDDIKHTLNWLKGDVDPTLPEGWSLTQRRLQDEIHAAFFRRTLADLGANLGVRSIPSEVFGLGAARFLQLESPSGVAVVFVELLQAPEVPAVTLLIEAEDARTIIGCLDLFELDRDDAVVIAPFLESASWPQVDLWRQDDNGNEFLISEHTSVRKARSLARRFEERGHKQSYWVRVE